MSRIEVCVCDHCGQRTDDYYEKKGWIHFDSSEHIEITVTNGRDKEGIAKTKYERVKELHFCRLLCLNNWLKKLR